MSYIRCGSNPEGLYIWSSGDLVHICAGPSKVKQAANNAQVVSVPTDQFEALLKNFKSTLQEDLHSEKDHPDLRTEEVWELPDGTIQKDCPNRNIDFESDSYVECDRKIALYYKDELVCTMWRVTWYYIAA